VDKLAEFYGNGSDELGLAFNFNFISAPFEAPAMRAIVEETEAALPPGAWPAWTGSNHDMFRFPTRWAEDDPARVRLALLMLLSLRGTPVLYQGDEIGMANVAVAHEDMRDPLGVRFYPYYEGRDAGRTPMQWSDRPGGGFTDADRPWLPLGDLSAANVAAQRDDPDSLLTLCHDLIAFRRRHPEFSAGETETLVTPDMAWAWTRGDRHVVALNLSPGEVVLPGLSGTVQIATDRARDLEAVEGDLRLAAFEGMLLERS
jgi:alpha-glucosidase